MNCPDKKTLQDFVDGELPERQHSQVAEHVRACHTCKVELNEILSLYKALNRIIDKDECFPAALLKDYADNICDAAQKRRIKDHLNSCGRCSAYIWAFGASVEELQNWQQQEELEYHEYTKKYLGYSTARDVLSKLLPSRLDFLDEAWNSVAAFVINLKTQAAQNWPSLAGGPQLAEALGFAESSDAQTDAASMILVTCLYVSQALADGEIEPSQKDLEAVVKDISEKLGAGKELRKRLIETVPSLILASRSQN
jgi:hypothetical protein